MVFSMTGFGHSAKHFGGYKVQIEMKSVNHRYCETVIRLPREWTCYEDVLKRTVQQRLRRGRIDIFINKEKEEDVGPSTHVNWPAAENYVQAASALRERFGFTDTLTLYQLMQLPDVLVVRDETSLLDEEVEAHLVAGVEEALNGLCEMRAREGQHLAEDTASRVTTLEKTHRELVELAPTVVEEYRARLNQRLEDMLDSTFKFDEQKFGMEVALFAERSNIDEELTRLKSHLAQCRKLLQEQEPVGRKLDFLIQEMNREVNTIGSKANHLALVNRVVDMKAELEKIREQVANME
ncbi:YicC family protein [Paenibacillus selenitireducens]|uniref:YicC family protein n=1 Tax=Paenibacillus selenitireducens TaxID=1324314 RepID=A0A1T2XFA4_9BACL|nr:YicC/YloC family endoribonuclease [Paenibacillus selenitireducens]OPA78574.1 YicC family protein [Paenibacillus selenitireducens]